MGSRFKGAIKTNAMPWKNQYIGNPLLTGALNLIFGAGGSDAHCGLRALTKACFERLHLSGHGMEFASEMIIKAHLKANESPRHQSRFRLICVIGRHTFVRGVMAGGICAIS